MSALLTVVQCWDDGVTTDARLTDLLRQRGIPATFNLCAGLYGDGPRFGWMHQGVDVWRLGWRDMRTVYEGFTIANHSLTHPNLCEMPSWAAREQIAVGRDRLQQHFGQPITGFAYPFGVFNRAVMDLVRETGHLYARTTESSENAFPPMDPMAFHPSCHFLAPDFWTRYESAKKGRVFYFWGHSYELVDEAMWSDLAAKLQGIDEDPTARWGELPALFSATRPTL